MSSGFPISDEVRRFVLTSIPSIPYMEAMLLLRSKEEVSWDASMLANRLYLSEKAASSLLTELHEAGILRTDAARPDYYCFAPSSESLRQMIDQVAEAYSTQLVAMTNLIHSTSGRKAQQFADAFKWRKDS
ncbi:hypothetical protein [Noviherbaspirillum saxi]|uniref:Transcriptional regulator n=1 Tax=Noviherbaspirillum saxi TaxID=2320863 RepID=A0A3A3FMX2_9BURK|nr:hypothetical protein [Noviherbaspirillum saxi]RJF97253.1 hypothetical protein D3871_00910 [Noviherbaspirillum saxi]